MNKINIFLKTIIICTIVFSFIAFLYSIIEDYGVGEMIENSVFRVSMIILGVLVLGFLYKKAFCIIDRFDRKKENILIIILFITLVIILTILFINIKTLPDGDSLSQIDGALYNVIYGKPIDGGNKWAYYYGMYGNTYGFTYYITLIIKTFNILKIKNYFNGLLIINILSGIYSIVMSLLIGIKLKGKKAGLKILFFLVTNPIYYFYGLYVYTNTFSMPYMLTIVYLLLLIKNKPLKIKIIISCFVGLLGGIGFFVRPTSIFPIVAFIIMIIFSKEKIYKSLEKILVIGVILSSLLIVLFVFNKKSEALVTKDLRDRVFPTTFWLELGSSSKGESNLEDVLITVEGRTKADKRNINISTIKKYFKEKYEKGGIIEIIKHFNKKIAMTFSDGNGRVLKGILYIRNEHSFLREIIVDKYWDIISFIMQIERAYLLWLLLVGVVSTFYNRDISFNKMMILICIFGGFIFYLFWEGKSTYSFPFIGLMSIIGINNYNNFLLTKKNIIINNIKRILKFSLLGVFIIMLASLSYNKLNKVYKKNVIHISINTRSEELLLNNKTIEQSFYVNSDFNKIVLFGYIVDGKEFSCKFSLLCEDKVIWEKNLDENNIFDDRININFNEKFDKNKTYKIVLDNIKGDGAYTLYKTLGYGRANHYKGELFIDSKIVEDSLLEIEVSEIKN